MLLDDAYGKLSALRSVHIISLRIINLIQPWVAGSSNHAMLCMTVTGQKMQFTGGTTLGAINAKMAHTKYYVINRNNALEPPPLPPSLVSATAGCITVDMKDLPPPNIPPKSDNQTVLQDDFSEHSGDNLIPASDASVHISNDTASKAWQLYSD